MPLYSIICCSEVSKALNKTKGLYQRWLELQKDTGLNVTKDDLEWTSTELRNSLRSIEWDIDDLEDTKNILSCIWFVYSFNGLLKACN